MYKMTSYCTPLANGWSPPIDVVPSGGAPYTTGEWTPRVGNRVPTAQTSSSPPPPPTDGGSTLSTVIPFTMQFGVHSKVGWGPDVTWTVTEGPATAGEQGAKLNGTRSKHPVRTATVTTARSNC